MTKESRKGFQRLKPVPSESDNITPKIIAEEDETNKPQEMNIEDIADKFFDGDHLTTDERRIIYKTLIRQKLPQGKKRGPKPKDLRDIQVAVDFITRKAKRDKRATEIKRELHKLYDLSGGAYTQDPDSTFYKVVNRGLELLENYCKCWLSEVRNCCLEELDSEYVEKCTALAKYHLQCIKRHRKQTKHLKK